MLKMSSKVDQLKWLILFLPLTATATFPRVS